MDPLKHRPEEPFDPEERGEEADRRAEGPRSPAGPAAGHEERDTAGGEESSPEFFVMDTEPSEEEEFVLASPGAEEGEFAAVGSAQRGPSGAEEEKPEWLVRGGEEVMDANAAPLELEPQAPAEVAEGAAAVGTGRGRSRGEGGRLRRFLKVGSIAAAAVLLLSVGVVYLRGGLFGKKGEGSVRVARGPKTPARPPRAIEPPSLPAPPEVPTPVEPEPAPPVKPDDVRRPPAPEPAPGPEPAPPTPAAPTGPISIRTPGGEFVLLKAGEVLLTLRNGNYFTGRIYRIGAEALTLHVPGGEIVFEMRTLAKIVPLAGAEKGKDEFDHLPTGYVELQNGNRIWGKILEETPDYTSIAFAAAKITIPAGSIRAVVRSAAATVGIAE